MKEAKPDTKRISYLEKMVRYSLTPIFLFEIIPITTGIYLATKVAQKKDYLSPEDADKAAKTRYVDFLKEVYNGRKDLYFPKKPLF
jgi:hypothetical protein